MFYEPTLKPVIGETSALVWDSSVLEGSDQELPGPILYLQWVQADTRYLIEKVDIREPIRGVHEQVARQPVVVGDVMIL